MEWLIWLIVIFGCVWLVVLICRMGSPKRPKPEPPVKALPAPRPQSPDYIPRWGQSRKRSVAADKAQWMRDFIH
jgi:hypothetical protein